MVPIIPQKRWKILKNVPNIDGKYSNIPNIGRKNEIFQTLLKENIQIFLISVENIQIFQILVENIQISQTIKCFRSKEGVPPCSWKQSSTTSLWLLKKNDFIAYISIGRRGQNFTDKNTKSFFSATKNLIVRLIC